MYVRINGKMIDSDEVMKISQWNNSNIIDITYTNRRSETIYCRNASEARDAVDTVVNAKNGIGKVYGSTPSVPVCSGYTTDERIENVDRQMAALAERKRQLQQQKAAEDSAEALAALLVGGVCAIADAISSRREAKKRK